MPVVRMYSICTCPYCHRAEQLLQAKGLQIDKILVDDDLTQMQKMVELSGRRTVPQIFIGDTYVGGYDDLVKLDQEGKLAPLLQQ